MGPKFLTRMARTAFESLPHFRLGLDEFAELGLERREGRLHSCLALNEAIKLASAILVRDPCNALAGDWARLGVERERHVLW